MLHLQWAKELKKEGERLGRAGMSERIVRLVNDYIEAGPSYFGAIELAGRLKAISQAANSDEYWREKVNKGYHKELEEIKFFQPSEDEKEIDEQLYKFVTQKNNKAMEGK